MKLTLEITDRGQLRRLRQKAIESRQSLAATASDLLAESLTKAKRQKVNKYEFFSKVKAS